MTRSPMSAVKKVDGITKESTQAMIDEALAAYPGEGAQEAGARTWRPTTRPPAAPASSRTARPCPA